VITGDNGLGKSFLLDVAWWALTRTWAGERAIPTRNERASTISYAVRDGKNVETVMRSQFQFKTQTWPLIERRRPPAGVVLYARLDGGFSVWDPARNGQNGKGVDRPDAYHFDQAAVFDGLSIHGKSGCEGLERDWVSWQQAGAPEFDWLKKALLSLSAPDEPIEPAAPRRVFVGEARDRPAVRVGGQEVPIVLASAGVRRVLAIAYLLVWAWREHWLEAELQRLGEPERRLVLLFDEPETHLHPRWQRTILPAVLRAADGLRSDGAETQVIAATHSPLVLASLEPLFDAERDGWLDLDLVGAGDDRRVELERRPFVRRGDVSAWLVSDAFDLKEARSLGSGGGEGSC
jgi:putative AbiEii toxin of type IV toxin-antitoxin system